MKRKAVLTIPCLLFLLSFSVYASDENVFELSLEELMQVKVVTVSRTEESLDMSPGSVYVITRETILRRGYSSLRDALQIVPGFSVFMRDLGYTGNVRGLAANDNEKFTLLINGFEMNQVNEPEFLNGPINLDNVERLEIIIGPTSIFRPANTLAATVNVITREPDSVELVGATGSERDYNLTVMGTTNWSDDTKASIAATIERREGFDAWSRNFSTAPMSNTAGTDITGGGSGLDHFLVAQVKHNHFSGQLISYNTTYPEVRLIGGGDAGAEYEDAMTGGNFSYSADISKNLQMKLSTSAVYKKVIRSALSGAPGISKKQYDYNSELGFVFTGADKHYLQMGIQHIYEEHFDNFVNRPNSGKANFFADRNTWGIGAYIDDTYRLNSNLNLIAGIRVDHNTLLNKNFLLAGRLAAVYRVSDDWTSKLLFNRAVRVPAPVAALREIEPFGSPVAKRAEVLETIEFGNTVYFGDTRLSANIYYQELDDFITWGSPHTNVGDYKGWGTELDLVHQLANGYRFWFNADLIESEFINNVNFDTVTNAGDAHRVANDDQEMIGSPKITVTTGLDIEFDENVQFSAQIRYFTKQAAEVTNDGGQTFTFKHVNNQFYMDASLLLKGFIGNGDLRISGKNLFNNRDEVAGPTLSGQYRPREKSIEIGVYFKL